MGALRRRRPQASTRGLLGRLGRGLTMCGKALYRFESYEFEGRYSAGMGAEVIEFPALFFSAPHVKHTFVRRAFDADSLATARLTHYWRGLHAQCVVVDNSATEFLLSHPRVRGLDLRVFPEESRWIAYPLRALSVLTLTCNVLLEYRVTKGQMLDLPKVKKMIIGRLEANPRQVVHRTPRGAKMLVGRARELQGLHRIFPL